jgi:16S rRNA (cytosine967-C5)-methyltransferase
VAPGVRVLDVCAAPGGKATLMAAGAEAVIAADRRLSRSRLVARNVQRLGAADVHVVVADGTAPPWRPGTFDRVLLDAPCSGLGVLRRRADARWRIDAEGIERLAALQRRLLTESQALVRVGGRLVYSVCTVTKAETIDQLDTIGPDFEPVPIDPGDRWRTIGTHGAMVLPQDHDTDGMTVFAWERTRGDSPQ